MPYLCLHVDASNQVTASEVPDVSACSAYVVDLAANNPFGHLTLADANELIGATASLFAIAFIFRAVIHFIQNR